MRTIAPALTLCFGLSPCLAQDDDPDKIPEGHSVHGAVFNEGPRQRAYLMEGMNEQVQFDVTTDSEVARRLFVQGVVQLHGFWYFEAERTFRQIAAIDPDCAMAYWGMAMANVDNQERAHGFAHEAWKRRDQADPREQRYIDMIARFYAADKGLEEAAEYEPPRRRSDEDGQRRQRQIEDYEELIHEYPNDVEAKAFLVNQLWLDQRAGRRIVSRHANQALLDQIFEANPLHPAHHYRVHLWDTKKTAYRVADSAAAIGHSAPGIAHMWHMGGHIWAQLDRHADAAFQQEASARVDHAHMMRDRVLPDQIHNYAHNNEWLSRSLRHVGQISASIDLSKNMIELPRHPAYNMRNGRYNSATFGRRRLIETLRAYEMWDELLELLDTMYLEPGKTREHRAEHAFLKGLAHWAKRDRAGCKTQIAVLSELEAEAKAERADAVDAAEAEGLDAGNKEPDIEKAMQAAAKTPTQQYRAIRQQRRQLDGLLACSVGDWDEGLEILEQARFDRAHLARLYVAAGKPEKALETVERVDRRPEGKAHPLATQAWVMWSCDKRDEALEKFDELRSFSSRFELDHPLFRRLAPLADARDLPADWRIPHAVPDDVGNRPPLDSLGPVRWSPMPAPEWKLPRGSGTDIALADYRGRPVLVVFFLGFGCVHCVEQLQALKPHTERFRGAGIEIVTIGTDTVEQVRESDELAGPTERYPFPILSDPELRVFQQYRCFDDFEHSTLHGTFLIDANGLVRWQDISYEPFMDVEFLLEESQRLLALPEPEAVALESIGGARAIDAGHTGTGHRGGGR